MARTRKNRNQLSIDLNGIEDNATREALMGVLNFVNELATSGLETQGTVIGKNFGTVTKSAAITDEGVGQFQSLDCGLGRLSFLVKDDSLPASSTRFYYAPSGKRILGCIGMGQVSGGSVWNAMRIGTTSGIEPFFYIDGTWTSNKLKVKNNDPSHTNSFHIIIFYAE